MNRNLTEIVFVMDRSGSMESMREEAIGSFNALVEEQRKVAGEVRFTLVLFDHEYDKPIDHVLLDSVPNLTPETYVPRGNTALLDAMGRTINELGHRLAETPEAERPTKVIVACMTDGMENASRTYTNKRVTEMIEHQRTVYSWDFLFLGATIESRRMAMSWKMKSDSIMDFAPTPMGVVAGVRRLSREIRESRESTS